MGGSSSYHYLPNGGMDERTTASPLSPARCSVQCCCAEPGPTTPSFVATWALQRTAKADRQIDACSKIIALKVFSGARLATVHFWRAVGWNKKGDYAKVIADTTEAIRLKPDQAVCNLRGSAYYDNGEYDIAIADFDDALKIGPPSGIIFHNRGNSAARRGLSGGEAVTTYCCREKYDRATNAALAASPTSFRWQLLRNQSSSALNSWGSI